MNVKILDSGDAIDLAQIREYEEKIGVPLPDDYRQFLIENNGGYPEPDSFNYKEKEGVGSSTVQGFLGFNLSDGNNVYDFLEHWTIDNMVPIAFDSCGNLIVMNLAEKEGYVFFWDHEEEDEINLAHINNDIQLIANSFTEFINSLYKYIV